MLFPAWWRKIKRFFSIVCNLQAQVSFAVKKYFYEMPEEKNPREWKIPSKLIMSINYFVYISPSKQFSSFNAEHKSKQTKLLKNASLWKVTTEMRSYNLYASNFKFFEKVKKFWRAFVNTFWWALWWAFWNFWSF